MENFMFQNPTRIHFDSESLEALTLEMSSAGENILLVIGSGSAKKSGLYDEVLGVLDKMGKETYLLEGIKGNPEIDKVYEGITICREKDIDFVLVVY